MYCNRGYMSFMISTAGRIDSNNPRATSSG